MSDEEQNPFLRGYIRISDIVALYFKPETIWIEKDSEVDVLAD